MEAKFGPGVYFLGDICYVLECIIYKDIWGKKHNYEEGQFSLVVTGEEESFAVESFAVARTAGGDGEYHDGQGREYGVDAGVIGIVPVSMWKLTESEIKDRGLGTVLKIKKGLTMEATNGIFTVTADDEKIIIDTLNQPEEGWDDWDDNELEDDDDLDDDLDDMPLDDDDDTWDDI